MTLGSAMFLNTTRAPLLPLFPLFPHWRSDPPKKVSISKGKIAAGRLAAHGIQTQGSERNSGSAQSFAARMFVSLGLGPPPSSLRIKSVIRSLYKTQGPCACPLRASNAAQFAIKRTNDRPIYHAVYGILTADELQIPF